MRWLRPAFQAPTEQRRAAQAAMPIGQAADTDRPEWPARDPHRCVAPRAVLSVRDMVHTLAAPGQAPGRLGTLPYI